MFTGTIAFVRGVILRSTSSGSRVSDSLTSAITGIALEATTAAAEAKKV